MTASHRFIRFLFFFLFIAASMSISFLGVALALVNNDRIAYGVCFENTSLNGLSREEASGLLTHIARKSTSGNAVILTTSNRQWQLTPQELGLTIDIDATLAEAYAIGRHGSFFTNLAEQISSAVYGHEIHLLVSFDEEKLHSRLADIAGQIDQAPVSASCTLAADGSIQHKPAVIGRKLNTERLTNEITPSLYALQLPVHAALHTEEQTPPVTDGDLRTIDSVLAVYTTHFSSANANRSQNIRISAGELDGVLVRKGDEFSFNRTVGARIASAGYKDAAVIVEGKVEQDIGGGVCQVSSTLYNAILLANLTPTARTAHFYPSTYVPAGLDATVADGQIDFLFRNDLAHNIYLLSSVYGNTLTVFVLGTKADLKGQNIDLERRIDKPGPGPVISVWRVYYEQGQETRREFLHTDHYDIEE